MSAIFVSLATCLAGVTSADWPPAEMTDPALNVPALASLLTFQMHFPTDGSCADLPASYFPLNIQMSSVTNQAYPPNQTGACGQITQDQLDAESPIVFAHCYTPSNGNWGNELDDVHIDISTADGSSSYRVGPDSFTINAVYGSVGCPASYVPFAPPSKLDYSTLDTDYLQFTVEYQTDMCLAPNTYGIYTSLYDPTGYGRQYTWENPENNVGSRADVYGVSARANLTTSAQDYGFPPIGQMMDGTWTIRYGRSSYATFQVGHAPQPTNVAFRKRDRRWKQFVEQQEPQQKRVLSGEVKSDTSSLFFKAPEPGACTHSVCPVWGKTGVFECIDTQTNLDSCGACPPYGRACADIIGAVSMSCVGGGCVVHDCEAGWQVSANGTIYRTIAVGSKPTGICVSKVPPD